MPQFDNYTGFTSCDTVIADMRPYLVVGFDIMVIMRWVVDGLE